jgi:hypothetical protein
MRHEGKKKTLSLIQLEVLWKVANGAKVLSTLALYHGLKADGKL